jgi:uracil-DNA glycosylase family 4
VIGLAPAANGGNRTGRMFTGDSSGEWLFGTLYRFGFANQPNSSRRDDAFALRDCYITATIRCAPPQNKPLPQEIESCRPYLLQELYFLKKSKVIVALGQIAFAQTLKSLRRKGLEIPSLEFGHGRVYPLPNGQVLISTYHPSQQNTQTGKLTRRMFDRIFDLVQKNL